MTRPGQDGGRPRAAGRRASLLLAGSVGTVALTGLLGPSVAEPPLPAAGGWPPYSLDLHPNPWLVTALLLAAVGTGAAGLLTGLAALRQGWQPSVRRLVAAGSVAATLLVLVPPMGSADVLVYAAYGRIAATGGDPYRQTAADLAARGDPVGRAVEAPWTTTPSVYGPVATAEQRLAAMAGGASPHRIVFLLAVAGAASYVGTTLLLLRLVGADLVRRRRVAVLWAVNPLLLAAAVNGAHVDSLGLVAAVAALVAVRRSAVAAGLLVAAACAVKLSFGLVVPALVWGLRRQPGRAATAVGAALVAGAALYATVGWHALGQARAAGRMVSFASPWRLALGPLRWLIGGGAARTVVGLAAAAALVAVAALLARAVPGGAPGQDRALSDRALSDRALSAARGTAILAMAWLVTASYSLPWYDVLAWAPLAAVPPSRFDRLLVARTATVAAAYVPGRAVGLPGPLADVTGALRGGVAPVVLAVLAGVVVASARSAWRPSRTG